MDPEKWKILDGPSTGAGARSARAGGKAEQGAESRGFGDSDLVQPADEAVGSQPPSAGLRVPAGSPGRAGRSASLW